MVLTLDWKVTPITRLSLGLLFFLVGMWLASDSGNSFLRGDIKETEKAAISPIHIDVGISAETTTPSTTTVSMPTTSTSQTVTGNTSPKNDEISQSNDDDDDNHDDDDDDDDVDTPADDDDDKASGKDNQNDGDDDGDDNDDDDDDDDDYAAARDDDDSAATDSKASDDDDDDDAVVGDEPSVSEPAKSVKVDTPYRYCNGLKKVQAPEYYKRGFYLRYRCKGPQYDEFANELHSFVEKEAPVSVLIHYLCSVLSTQRSHILPSFLNERITTRLGVNVEFPLVKPILLLGAHTSSK